MEEMGKLKIPMGLLDEIYRRIEQNGSDSGEDLFRKIEESKVKTANETTGTLTGYDCKKCKNRGYTMYLGDDGKAHSVECDCRIIRRCVKKMEASGLKNMIRDYTFKKFVSEEPWQLAMKTAAEEYAKNMDGWFMICGQSGCGKTHICTAICRERLLAGDEVVFMPWVDECVRIKARANSTERDEIIFPLKTAKTLYIDDFLKTGGNLDDLDNYDRGDTPSGADIRIAYEVLNYRYINRLPTVISTERMPEELLQIDEAMGGRIIEMAGEHVYRVRRDKTKNYRLRGVKDL